jgi:hypothetical protein
MWKPSTSVLPKNASALPITAYLRHPTTDNAIASLHGGTKNAELLLREKSKEHFLEQSNSLKLDTLQTFCTSKTYCFEKESWHKFTESLGSTTSRVWCAIKSIGGK